MIHSNINLIVYSLSSLHSQKSSPRTGSQTSYNYYKTRIKGSDDREPSFRVTLTCSPAVRFLTRVSKRLWSSSSSVWICCRSRLGWTRSSGGSSLPSALGQSLRPREGTRGGARPECHVYLFSRRPVDSAAEGEQFVDTHEAMTCVSAGWADAISERNAPFDFYKLPSVICDK